MLPHIFQILESWIHPLDKFGHPTERRYLDTLAAIKRIGVLDHSGGVSGNIVAEIPHLADVGKSDLVVISLIHDTEEILVKRMKVVQARKFREDFAHAIVEVLLGELDLVAVEASYS